MYVFLMLIFCLIPIYIIVMSCAKICGTIKSCTDTVAVQEIARYGTLKKDKNLLTLEKRDVNLRKYIKIKKVYSTSYGYEPEKYVYTGATVGGVTTGGIHKQNAYNYVSGIKNTGKYSLMCGDVDLFNIELSSALLEAAKKSSINKYLDGNVIKLYGNAVLSSYAIDSAKSYINNSNMSSFNALNAELTTGFPSYEKCNEILNWLCGE